MRPSLPFKLKKYRCGLNLVLMGPVLIAFEARDTHLVWRSQPPVKRWALILRPALKSGLATRGTSKSSLIKAQICAKCKMYKVIVTLCLLSEVIASHTSGHTNNWAVLVSKSCNCYSGIT